MRVKPLQDGSRSVEIDTAYLLLNATANTDGTVTVHACEVREPRKPSEADAKLADIHLAICNDCDSLTKHKPDLLAVSCKDCGCGNLSLVKGKCPRKRW